MRLAVSLLLACSAVGCGRAAAQPAFYSGRTGTSVVGAAQVTTESAVPDGDLLVGDVAARCRADDGVVALDEESLADVDCSDALLLDGLREKAASVGGTALVEVRCVTSAESRGDLLDSELHSCSAFVAAPSTAAPAASLRLSGKDAAFVPPYADSGAAFHVSVTVVPVEKAPLRRKAIASESVAELAVVQPGRVVVGDIVASGEDDCGKAVVRHAVRAAAGRVGATDVVGVACVQQDSGWLCTGRATRPERDEYARSP
ncbi:MAG TPA: hypothetical protein VH062_17710 [Polyangiaceae bacterium]|jgi:hypothetical protein|nr:hypothetical protein [Polyangiaceae bacterium]